MGYISMKVKCKVENAKVMISYEADGETFQKPVHLMSTDVKLNAKTIIEYCSKRWAIETNYKYLKTNLEFDKYRVCSLLSIRILPHYVFSNKFSKLFRLLQNGL